MQYNKGMFLIVFNFMIIAPFELGLEISYGTYRPIANPCVFARHFIVLNYLISMTIYLG